MRYASVAEVKARLSAYLSRARRKKEAIVVTRHGRPYALIQPLSEKDLEELAWNELVERRLRRPGRESRIFATSTCEPARYPGRGPFTGQWERSFKGRPNSGAFPRLPAGAQAAEPGELERTGDCRWLDSGRS
jgi:prevent-host-death family protein